VYPGVKAFHRQHQMIVLLRRKIILNKTSTFSKEINGPIDPKIANVNVHFFLSRLKTMQLNLAGLKLKEKRKAAEDEPSKDLEVV
jgi:hypothetical protein